MRASQHSVVALEGSSVLLPVVGSGIAAARRQPAAHPSPLDNSLCCRPQLEQDYTVGRVLGELLGAG